MPPERVAFVIYNNSRLRSRKSAIIVNNKLAFARVLFASLTLIAPRGKTSIAKSSLVNSSRKSAIIVNNKLAFARVLFASLTLIAPGGKTSAAKSSLVNSSRRASLYGYFE